MMPHALRLTRYLLATAHKCLAQVRTHLLTLRQIGDIASTIRYPKFQDKPHNKHYRYHRNNALLLIVIFIHTRHRNPSINTAMWLNERTRCSRHHSIVSGATLTIGWNRYFPWVSVGSTAAAMYWFCSAQRTNQIVARFIVK